MNYSNIYQNLIEKARKRLVRPDKTEKHHIIPECMGGLDEEDNLIYLSPREHFVAHLLLCKMHPTSPALAYAVLAFKMSNAHQIRTSRDYDFVRRIVSEDRSEKMKEKWKNPEYREKMSKMSLEVWDNRRKGIFKKKKSRVSSEEAGKITSEYYTNKWKNLEFRSKMLDVLSKARGTGKTVGPQPERTCPYCGKIGRGGPMTRYHFENCKTKDNNGL